MPNINFGEVTGMEIVKLQKKDIKAALDLVWRVFLEFDAPDYSQQGLEEFRSFFHWIRYWRRLK